MGATCGCGDDRDRLAKNDAVAASNRRKALRDGIFVFHLIGSPGAGKTALLASLRPHLGPDVAVMRHDTGAPCHLDAAMVRRGLDELAPRRGTIVFVENVGSLVCPALFDLGEYARIVVMSTTEGDDKPLAYPHAFRTARLLALTKTDLLPHVTFDEDRCVSHARAVSGPHLRVVRTSALRGEGIVTLAAWLKLEAAR